MYADNDDDDGGPVRDHGSFAHAHAVDPDDIEGHHTQNWQHGAMYIGLHLPQQHTRKRRHRGHHHRRHKKDHHHHHHQPSDGHQSQDPTGADKPFSTSGSERIPYGIGSNNSNPDFLDDEEHQSHDIFCEMDELRPVEDGGMEWKETARWVKFEEDVEEGGERWSKPHVATLSLHSLFELRKGIMSGTVMLDLEASNLFQVADLVLDNMIGSKQLDEEQRERVHEVLLCKHRHQHDKKKGKGLPGVRSIADIGRKHSSKNLEGENSLNPNRSASHMDRVDSGSDLPHTPSQQKFNEHFMKKIPQGAEASNILVGEVDFLAQPIIAFVRLAKAILLSDLTEVPVPTRFIFIMLGPTGNASDYHEIGRSIATLMSDEVFHDIAYKSRTRNDLLSGIDEFLDEVTVLPPGEWDPTIRIEPPKSIPSQENRKGKLPTIHKDVSDSGTPGGDKSDKPSNGGMNVEHADEAEDHSDQTLERTGRLFGGLIGDLRRKLPYYWSDIKDGLHVQCIASLFFMYFACLAPIITFGGLLGSATDNNIAAMESLLAGAISGISYHLFSGQPLTIIGSTGPVLIFETIVFNFCEGQKWNYLSFRLWIGLWVAAILMIMVAFDLSALVRYITRFTEESFALLIALIFIVEAFKKLFHILDHYGVDLKPDEHISWNFTCDCRPFEPGPEYNGTTLSPQKIKDIDWDHMKRKDCVDEGGELVGPGCHLPEYVANVFFLCCLLFIFTFFLAYTLKNIKTARFFTTRIRQLISDFSVMAAVVIMVGVDAALGLDTPKLIVPSSFKPTRDDRSWVINPFENEAYCIGAALVPALLATILIFMDQQITAVIVNRKENLLKKGGGYHLDLFVLSIQIAVASILGLPWFVAATVLSINHVRSLSRESKSAAPGERPKFLGVREQRLTGIITFLLVGLSVLMTQVLKYIPMAVLYGVFLFMGISALKGVQMVQRVLIMFMPAKYQPDYMFLRHVPLRRVHLFTAVQIICLGCLWTIKSISAISIVFPILVLGMCFIRKMLDYVFTRHELKWLDDIMPEFKKREKEEKKRQQEQFELGENAVVEMTDGAVTIPLKEGGTINIPVGKMTFDPKTKNININEEMSSTQLWSQLEDQDSQTEHDKNKARREPVRFTIAQDDDDEDADSPKICIDPPSNKGSPDKPSSPLNETSPV